MVKPQPPRRNAAGMIGEKFLDALLADFEEGAGLTIFGCPTILAMWTSPPAAH